MTALAGRQYLMGKFTAWLLCGTCAFLMFLFVAAIDAGERDGPPKKRSSVPLETLRRLEVENTYKLHDSKANLIKLRQDWSRTTEAGDFYWATARFNGEIVKDLAIFQSGTSDLLAHRLK